MSLPKLQPIETTRIDDSWPFISIIIPTYDRSKQLANCLQSLCGLAYPRDRFEVIVVDDGGRIAIDEVVASFQSRLDLRLVRQDHAGPGAARNTGSYYAKGELLAFTDDDCAPAVYWLRSIAHNFKTDPLSAIGGHTVNGLQENAYSAASQMIQDVVYDNFNTNPADAIFFASNNLSLPASRFRFLRGFDASFRVASEDREMCDRWRQHGYRMTYAPEAVVVHSHRLTLLRFLRQHFSYGRGSFRFHQSRAANGFTYCMLPPRFYWDLLISPFHHASLWNALLLSLLILFSRVANTLGFLWEWLLKKQQRAPAAKTVKPAHPTEP